MKSICVITSVHPVLDKRIFNREILSLKKFDYDVDLIAPSNTEHLVIQGVNVYGIPQRRKLLRVFNWVRIIKLALKKQYSAYHFHDPDLLGVGVALKCLTKKPVVYDVHEHYPETLEVSFRRYGVIGWFVAFVLFIVESLCAKIVHNAIVVDDVQFKRFKKLGCNTLLLYNYAKLHDFPEENVKKAYVDKTVIHTGTLSVDKGLLTLVDIIGRVGEKRKDIKFVVVKRFLSGEQEERCEEQFRKLQGEANLEMIDAVAPSKMVKIISRGSIGVLLDQPIGQYTKSAATRLYEYMACGLAVIDQDNYLQRQIIANNDCGVLVDTRNAENISRIIIELMDSSERLKKMGENARSAFVKKYNWESLEGMFCEYYGQVINN